MATLRRAGPSGFAVPERRVAEFLLFFGGSRVTPSGEVRRLSPQLAHRIALASCRPEMACTATERTIQTFRDAWEVPLSASHRPIDTRRAP